MKKLILFLILISLNINVEAKNYGVYYSEFNDFSEYIEEKIDSSDLVDVEIERRYRFYEEKIEGKYLEYAKGIKKYPYYNSNDYFVTGYGDWQYTVPEDIPHRIVQSNNDYKISRLKSINSLVITDIEYSDCLTNIKIYINDEEVNYNLIDNEIIINFEEPIYIQDSSIKIENLFDINRFTILGKFEEKIYFSNDFTSNEKDVISFTAKDFKFVNPEFEEEQYYDVKPNVSNLDNVEIVTKYRYEDKYIFFYNINKEYVDGYFGKYNGYVKDELAYKDYYRYRTRDKIMVEDEINIDNYDKKLEDFIISSCDYKIETNINYLENGIYNVSYITDFITITKEVKVDIVENDLRKELDKINNDYEKLMNEYKMNEIKIKDLENIINENNIEIEELNKQNIVNNKKYNELLRGYNNLEESYIILMKENNSLSSLNEKYSLDLVELNLKNTDNEKKLKLSNQTNAYLEKNLLNVEKEQIDINNFNIFHFLTLGIVVLLVIVFIIKKLSHKN